MITRSSTKKIPKRTKGLVGAGLGLRRSMLEEIFPNNCSTPLIPSAINFFEIAPENWIKQSSENNKKFAQIAEAVAVSCHGLSLNLGGYAALNTDLIQDIGQFMRQYRLTFYSEHLSYTADSGQLYDLLPLPRCAEAVMHVAKRIKQTQDILGMRIAIENASSYTGTPLDELGEAEFYIAVAEEADCDLHLDVNNVYVNSINFKTSAEDFLRLVAKRASKRVVYLHMAGHYQEKADFLIDTHGADVKEDVWQLLATTYQYFGILPTLLERDFNIPPIADLLLEVNRISDLQQQANLPSTQQKHG